MTPIDCRGPPDLAMTSLSLNLRAPSTMLRACLAAQLKKQSQFVRANHTLCELRDLRVKCYPDNGLALFGEGQPVRDDVDFGGELVQEAAAAGIA